METNGKSVEPSFRYIFILCLLLLLLLGHGVVVVDERFLVVGGNGEQYTESCVINNDDDFECTNQESKLTNYYNYPILTTVSDDFNNCA